MDLYFVQLDKNQSTIDRDDAVCLSAVDPAQAAEVFVQTQFRHIGRPSTCRVAVRRCLGLVVTRWDVEVRLVPKATAVRAKAPPPAVQWLGVDFTQRWQEACKAGHWLRLADLLEEAQGHIFNLIHGPSLTPPAADVVGAVVDLVGIPVDVGGRLGEEFSSPRSPASESYEDSAKDKAHSDRDHVAPH